MFKKILILLLCILVLISMYGCGQNRSEEAGLSVDRYLVDDDPADDYDENDGMEGTGTPATKTISGDVQYASLFSEGLMFVKLNSDDEKVYCIDKNGSIVFELDDQIINIHTGTDGSVFMGGYAFLSACDESGKYYNALCSKEGKLIYPSDVGATNFYGPNEILKSGYILATKITADYSQTVSQLGVLNTSFEWVVPLSESLYEEFSSTLTDGWDENFVVGDCFYSVSLSKSLNLRTGEVKKANLKAVTPASEWGVPGNCEAYYRIQSNMVVPEDGKYIDLVGKNAVAASQFVNGTAGVVYHNETADMYFITMIDEKGNHLFEPTELQFAPLSFKLATDGQYLIYIENSHIVCRDSKGNKLGEFNIQSFVLPEIAINEGIITVSGKYRSQYQNGDKVTFCFDSQLNRIF